MKAITYSRTGESSVLQLQHRPVPDPGAGEVRVRIVVSGVNPTDWKHRKGAPPSDELEFPELVPHHDGAGVVDAVGFDVGASLGVPAITAHHIVNYKAGGTAKAIREVAPDGVDIVVEVAPAQNAALDAAVVSNRATIAIYANDGGDSVELDIIPNMWVNARYQFLVLYTVGADALANGRDDVASAVRDGAMGVGESAGLPLHYFPLEETAAAHDAVESGVTGKVLVQVSE
ncbi:alcohol dehydrogenase catalytic domain-containing protein [Mycolicibacterium baixiangningiae]|uniref:alcohol dehydrogenase catalytic domain-containing protein n=1 Tax=Mycolicibacterium baixiangningiae TaxID=2761578 RepID=UPI0018D1597E|nr:zinc-binding dehydrogenase [Mycolicibacterium baixiangningiae]